MLLAVHFASVGVFLSGRARGLHKGGGRSWSFVRLESLSRSLRLHCEARELARAVEPGTKVTFVES